jgi:signal transduction histidine kinase
LLALSLRVEKAARGQHESVDSRLEQLNVIQNELSRLAEETRLVSHALGPGVLDQLGLVTAIRTMLENFDGTAIEANLTVVGQEERLHPDMELGLFRIVQEALNNVKKHSQAHSLQLRLQYDIGTVKLTIVDDGKGFHPPRLISDFAASKKLGVIGMEQRVQILGGRMLLQSKPYSGTAIEVEIPRVAARE